jgi:hypothetical protein
MDQGPSDLGHSHHDPGARVWIGWMDCLFGWLDLRTKKLEEMLEEMLV